MWQEDVPRKEPVVITAHYEVRALGTLPEWASWEFDRLAVERRPQETILQGQVPDSSALVRLLLRLELLGLHVVSFRRTR
jgi:hypothetical protein